MTGNKIKFKIRSDKFSDLISKLDDLTKIDDSIKLKIDNDNILMYSMLGGRVMLAFKSYLINTKEYLDYDGNIDFLINLIIPNSKKFVKNLNFIKQSEKITIDILYKISPDDDEIVNARSFNINGGKLKVKWMGGEQFEMKDLTKESLSNNLNLKNRKWYFSIEKSDFYDIKKLSSINSERIIDIIINKGVVIFSEKSAWELEVGKIDDDRNSNLILNKKFLGCINESDNIEFNIFENFILIKDESSDLILSFEQNFEDD